jgi:hypothetical protein
MSHNGFGVEPFPLNYRLHLACVNTGTEEYKVGNGKPKVGAVK